MPISDSQFNTGCVNIRQASSESVWAWINITGFDSGLVPRIRFRYSLQGIRAKFDAGATEAPREFVNRYAVSEVQVESAASVRLLWREFVNAIHRQGTNFRSRKSIMLWRIQ